MSWRRTRHAFVALIALMLALAPAAAEATPAWSIVASPNQTGDNGLTSVSCTSATSCTAVGAHSTDTVSATLIERWNGSAWSIVPSPSRGSQSSLTGVSCPTANRCFAVGVSYSGEKASTLIESWNGATWAIQSSPNFGTSSDLEGVSCVAANSCKAVGSYQVSESEQRTLTLSWNGTSWTRASSPYKGTDSFLDSVSCVSANSCKAVGTYSDGIQKTLIVSWNGTNWSLSTSPNVAGAIGNVLVGVSCATAASCKAVGEDTVETSGRATQRTLVLSWNGSSWSHMSSPNNGSHNNFLYGVSCASATSCKAVGSYTSGGSGSPDRTLIESWNGSAWSLSVSPNRGTLTNQMQGVDCASAIACEAVGVSFSANALPNKTLVESYG